MARSATGIDVGRSTAKVLRGRYKGNTFHVEGFHVVANPGGSDEGWLASGWSALAEGLAFRPGKARIALSGKDVNVRYTRVPRLPDWQLRNLMRFEVAEIGDQSGSEVASDFNLLPEIPEVEGEDVVLLAMARESRLEEERAGLARIGATLEGFSPAAVALYNAWLRYGVVQDDTVLVANIGHDNIDVVIARGPDLLFARNLSGGSRLFDEAIAAQFGLSVAQARKLKEEAVDLRPGAVHATPNHERASRACLAAAGQVLSLLQSSVLFCKSQIKISGLKLDRVFLCGGGAALHGLPEYLRSGLAVAVELFDPFRVVDVSALAPEVQEELEDYKLESVVALGLATMGSDPDAYGLEILPEAVARRRAFWGGTIWLIAAGVLAVAFLALKVVHYRGEVETVRAVVRTLERELSSTERVHGEVARLAEENQELQVLVRELQGTAGLGEQAARCIDFLGADLPAKFWITEFSGTWGVDPELGLERGAPMPIALVKGRVEEGTDSPTQRFEEMILRLREQLGPARFKRTVDRDRFALDLTLFAPPALDAPPAAAEPAPEGN